MLVDRPKECLPFSLDELEASVASLQSAAASLNADCVLLRDRVVSADEAEQQQHQDDKAVKKTAQYLVRQRADEKVKAHLHDDDDDENETFSR